MGLLRSAKTPRRIDPRANSSCGMLHGDAAAEVVLGHERSGGTLGDQGAALLHEVSQFLQAFEAHAAADVVALVDHAQIGRLRESSCRAVGAVPVLAMPAIMVCGGAADVREDDHVVLRAQVAVAQFLVGEVGVGHSVIVERGAHPAFILRARPGVDVADARDASSRASSRRARRPRPRRRARGRGACGSRRARSAFGMMKAPARNLWPLRSKSSSATRMLHVLVLEAEGHQGVVAGVLHYERRRRCPRCRRRPWRRR